MSILGNCCTYLASSAGKLGTAAAEMWKSKPCQSATQRLLDTIPSTATSMASTVGVNGYNFLHGFEVHLWTGAAGGFIGGIFDNFFHCAVKRPKCSSAQSVELGESRQLVNSGALEVSTDQGTVHTYTSKHSKGTVFPASIISSPVFVAMLLVAAAGQPFTWPNVAAIAAGNFIGYLSQPISQYILKTNPCYEQSVKCCETGTLRGVKCAEHLFRHLLAFAASAGVATLIEFHQHGDSNLNGSNNTNSSSSGDFPDNQYQHPIHV